MPLYNQTFNRLRAGRDKVSASEYNQLVGLVEKMSRSLMSAGIVDSTGFTTRRPPVSTICKREIGIVRRAKTTENAPAATHINANLYDEDGVEQTSGPESNLDIYCSIMGGVDLEDAVPRLVSGSDIFVSKLPLSSSVDRWYCVTIFNKVKVVVV